VNPEESPPAAHLNADHTFPASCWTLERQRIKDWLAQESPSLSQLYEGAVLILFELRPPGYHVFVAHAVREIGNGLEFILFGVRSRPRLDYTGPLDQLSSQWKSAGFSTDGSLTGLEAIPNSDGSRPEHFKLPVSLARSISKLIAYHGEPRETAFDRAKKLFTRNSPENEKFGDAIRPGVEQWQEIAKWFMANTHDKRLKEEVVLDHDELRKNFVLFETALGVIARPFFETTDELDKIIEAANS
jgi:hypothetical protein